jgi:hypothetical protein
MREDRELSAEKKTKSVSDRPRLRQELAQLPPKDAGIELLATPVEWMRYCSSCDRERKFCADRQTKTGLLGYCTGCGTQGHAPFTRMQWEELT